MAVRPLALKRQIQATAFRGFVSELQKDVALNRIVKTWRSWEGEAPDDDVAPFADDNGVSIRITPVDSDWSRLTITGHRDMSLTVLVETFTPESGVNESLDLWDKIEDTIMSSAFETVMLGHGVWEIEVVSAASPAKDSCGDLTVDSARIKLFIST